MEDLIPGLKGRFFVEENDPDDNFVKPKYKVQKDFQYPCFDPDTPWNECKPVLGMKFESPSQLKQCLANYDVTHGYQLWYMQNDTYKLLVKCGRDVSAGKCAGKGGKKQVHIDDSLDKGSARSAGGSSDKGKGKLGEDRSEPSKVSQATKERWRKKKLEEKESLKNAVDCPFRLWASWMSTKKSFQIKTLYPDHKCCINYNLGSLVTYRWITEHYAREIIDNPWGSYNYMQNSKRSKFMINVSLGRCKRAKRASLFDHEGAGWLEGCRKVIGLDGCFLTHICKGKLLTAMGRDENNQMFLIVWAVVGVENKNNWTWFLSLLSDDLNLDHGAGLTVISDGHKGLLEAVKIWLPDAEQRQSASSLNEQFLEVMEEIKALDENAYSWLVDHDPNTWCRAYFELDRSCAAFENGISKSFNSKILSARGKPIITMLEDIRVYIMQKVWFLNKTAMELNDSITPFARRHLEFMKIRQRKWVVYASGFQEVEVRRQDEAFGVNIHLKKCACKMWELTGLPCVHAVAGYTYLKKDPELGVSEWFSKNKWFESYQYSIRPISGTKLWKKLDIPKPLPPGERKLPGRPRKRRIRHPSEYDHEISRVGRVMHCHRCWQAGHNKSKCTNAPKPKPDNFYENPDDEERQHGSNVVMERNQYQQAGPSVDETPKYREDPVMPSSNSGNPRLVTKGKSLL
ncbi:zinc finger, PMZ-type containing protein [Tanacetum coccineum]